MTKKTEDRARPPAWHHLDVSHCFAQLETSPHGLSHRDVEQRRERYGPNRLRPPKRRGLLQRLGAQFHNALIYVLLAAATVTAALQHWVDTGVILAVVLINALIGFIQEGKAEKALDAIRQMLSPKAMVWRDGKATELAAEDLVPGDVVVLQSGDRVPADLRLFKVKDLRVDESMLTGESEAVEKSERAVSRDATIGDRRNMAYSGTLVTFGQGRGIVVATGDHTEIGRISRLLDQVETLTTPLLRQMARFGRWLTAAIIALAGATFAFGTLVRDYAAADMFLAAVGLAVAAIPEGLPAIMTITLAIGVQRMARRNAIIRRLPAVETLGSVTVICSDKTGTLTRNEMTVRSVATRHALFAVTGGGYDPHGIFMIDDQAVDPASRPVLTELGRAAVLCNDSALHHHDGRWELHGDPTEGALLVLGMKLGLDPEYENEARPRTDAIPFESQHRFMATLHHDHKGQGYIYVKGAPERLLQMCVKQYAVDGEIPIEPEYWHTQMERIAERGHRLLAVATRRTTAEHVNLSFGDVDGDLTLLGILGIIDPPRDEAIEAVKECKSAGIRVKMITGDHAVTAAAIGRQMGIGTGDNYITGNELEAHSDAMLARLIHRADVFARTSPEQKLRLVQALQADGEVVAMTGDGVNDAPALRRADVGVAMGRKGTEAAKEAAEMVLADDNFASIAHAVEEGRTVYDNLKKAILFILPTNGGEAFILIAAIAMGRVLPITPVQILWINMITAVTLALALAFEPPETTVMNRPPRKVDEPLLSTLLIWRVVFVSMVLVVGTFGLYLWERDHGMGVEQARTVAVNTLVFFEIFYLFNARYLTGPVLNRAGLFGNKYALWAIAILIVFQLLLTYAPPMQLLFHTVALSATVWIKIVAVSASVLFLVELEKLAMRIAGRRRRARHRSMHAERD